MRRATIYTDGACLGNPGPGGWGALLKSGSTEKELFGGERLTTNNRMELMAVIQALQALKRPCAVTLHVDSQYVLKGMTEALDELVNNSGHAIEWRWVRGHNGDPGNERADLLANRGVEVAMGRLPAPM